MAGVELDGYNKVADNTFVNLSPMFAGRFVRDLPWDETKNPPFDQFDFGWNRFNRSGYHTLYAEDAPKIAIFNYFKKGFEKPPADHYLRPFSLAMEYSTLKANSEDHCIGDRLETNVVLDYVERFLA